MGDLLTYCSIIISYIQSAAEGVLAFFCAVPAGILNKFPFENYFLLYIFTVVPVIVWLLMKIPAVSDFMMRHPDTFFLTRHFDFGIIISVFVHKDGIHLLGNLLIVIPVAVWCGSLMENDGCLDWKKLGFILEINMTAKWLVVALRSHSRWSDGQDISAGMSGEIYCMLFTALAVCAKTWNNDLITAFIYIFSGITVIISLAAESGRNSKTDGGVPILSSINGMVLGSILPVI